MQTEEPYRQSTTNQYSSLDRSRRYWCYNISHDDYFIASSNLKPLSILMTSTEILGLIAACLTTMAFFPQAVHSWRTRDVSGVSLTMYGTFTFGVVLWLIYGILIESLPVILSNLVTLPLSMSILYLKLKKSTIGTPKD